MVDGDDDLRREALIADLTRLATGWMPDEATLSAAPLIDDWYADFYPGSRDVCLVGNVTGHPHLGGPIIITSPVKVRHECTLGVKMGKNKPK